MILTPTDVAVPCALSFPWWYWLPTSTTALSHKKHARLRLEWNKHRSVTAPEGKKKRNIYTHTTVDNCLIWKKERYILDRGITLPQPQHPICHFVWKNKRWFGWWDQTSTLEPVVNDNCCLLLSGSVVFHGLFSKSIGEQMFAKAASLRSFLVALKGKDGSSGGKGVAAAIAGE